MAPSLTPFDALSVDAFDAAGVSSSGVGVSDGASALSRGAAAAPLGSGMADSPPVTGLPSGDLLGVGSISLPCLGVSTAAEALGSWTGFEWLPHPMSPSALKTTRKRDSLSLDASRHVSESNQQSARLKGFTPVGPRPTESVLSSQGYASKALFANFEEPLPCGLG